MRTYRRMGLFVLLLTGVVGCIDDYSVISRDQMALEAEDIDFLMKVVDEPSAVEYKFYKEAVKPKVDLIEKRIDKWVANLDKKDTKMFDFYRKFRGACIADLTIASEETIRALDKSLSEKIKKDNEGKEDTKKEKERPEALPKAEMGAYFFRSINEAIRVQKAMRRETRRLKGVLAGLEEEKIAELKLAGETNPKVSAVKEWPALFELVNGKSEGGSSAPPMMPPMIPPMK